MKYERLTKRNEKWEYSFVEDEDVYIRLQELEDKIENGTLIELPCKVRDKVYEVFNMYYGASFIKETTIEKIVVTAKGLKLRLARNSVYETAISRVGKTLFFTKAEAEAKLKELQNGKTN